VPERLVLAGDVGGTKVALALVSEARGAADPVLEATVPTAGAAGLAPVLRGFLTRAGAPVERAVLGVPGPVVDGRCDATNLPWHLEEERIAADTGIGDVTLVNDLVATALAIPELGRGDLHTIQPGEPERGGTCAVVAPGTGLGQAILLCGVHGRYRALASEGGHTDFAPQTPLEDDLLRYLRARYGHVSYERVCSGSAIPEVYAFLRDAGIEEEPAALAAHLASAGDATPPIMQGALAEDGPAICQRTLEIFACALAAEAGNLALTAMATGGIYLGGGIPPKICHALDTDAFRDRFRYKGRLSGLMERIPVHVILNDRAAVLGAARRALAED
jgi:glucokinase